MIKARLLWLMLLLSLFSTASAAHAHSGSSEAFSNITVENAGVTYRLRVDLGELLQAAIPDVRDGNSSPSQDDVNRYLTDHQQRLETYLFSHINLYADGVPLEGSMRKLSEVDVNDRPFAEAELYYPVNQKPEMLSLSYNLIFDDVDQGHANYAALTLNGERQEFIMTYEFRDVRLGEMSLLHAAKQFFLHGVGHLFTGYDHLLFLICLVMGARSFKRILAVITAFTAAHSATLIVAGLHIFTLPAKFVEPAIALSIIYVAMMNLFYRDGRHNIGMAFGFGLIHGFGFAGTLSELKLEGGQMVSSLLFFNVGIEAGQLLLVLVLFPIIHYIRKADSVKWPVPAISITVSLFGLFWLIQRVVI